MEPHGYLYVHQNKTKLATRELCETTRSTYSLKEILKG
jgi:hypothetical protein